MGRAMRTAQAGFGPHATEATKRTGTYRRVPFNLDHCRHRTKAPCVRSFFWTLGEIHPLALSPPVRGGVPPVIVAEPVVDEVEFVQRIVGLGTKSVEVGRAHDGSLVEGRLDGRPVSPSKLRALAREKLSRFKKAGPGPARIVAEWEAAS